MIAWRFGFGPLGARGDSNNLARALNFSAAPEVETPTFSVESGPFGGLCLPLATLLDIAGIPLPVPLPDIPVLPLPLQIKTPAIPGFDVPLQRLIEHRSEEHTSVLQSLMRLSYAVFCFKKKTHQFYSNSLVY